MIPILCVSDVLSARKILIDVFNFSVDGKFMALGDQKILIVKEGEFPKNMIPIRLDHVAISIQDVEKTCEQFMEDGATLHPSFTPDGPVEINEFWDRGVRFVFFNGPEGAPIEFCERIGERNKTPYSHGHYGVRCLNISDGRSQLSNLDPQHVANFKLVRTNQNTNVDFYRVDNALFEIFDEPDIGITHQGTWIGLVTEG